MLRKFLLNNQSPLVAQPEALSNELVDFISGGSDQLSASFEGGFSSNNLAQWDGIMKMTVNVPINDVLIQPKAVINGQRDVTAFGVQVTVPVRLF